MQLNLSLRPPVLRDRPFRPPRAQCFFYCNLLVLRDHNFVLSLEQYLKTGLTLLLTAAGLNCRLKINTFLCLQIYSWFTIVHIFER